MTTTQLSTHQMAQVFELWNQVYPSILTYDQLADFQHYMDRFERPLYRLIVNGKKIVAWLVEMDRSDSRWFIIIVHSDYQGRRLEQQLMEAALQENTQLFGGG